MRGFSNPDVQLVLSSAEKTLARDSKRNPLTASMQIQTPTLAVKNGTYVDRIPQLESDIIHEEKNVPISENGKVFGVEFFKMVSFIQHGLPSKISTISISTLQ